MKYTFLVLSIVLNIKCFCQSAPPGGSNVGLQKLDSILYSTLGYQTGKYWNTIWARYYALDDFKGLRSLKDANIVRYNLYSEKFPLVLINDLPLVFYEIGTIDFVEIESAVFSNSVSDVTKKVYPFLQYGVLKIKADIKEQVISDVALKNNIQEEYKYNYDLYCSPVGLNSFLDSALLKTVGLNRNQCYNYLIFDFFQRAASCDLCKPRLSSKPVEHPLVLPQPLIMKDTVYSIYCNGLPMDFFDDANWRYSRFAKGIVTSVNKTIEQQQNTQYNSLTKVRIDITAE